MSARYTWTLPQCVVIFPISNFYYSDNILQFSLCTDRAYLFDSLYSTALLQTFHSTAVGQILLIAVIYQIFVYAIKFSDLFEHNEMVTFSQDNLGCKPFIVKLHGKWFIFRYMTNLSEHSDVVNFRQDSKAANCLQFSYKILHSLGILWKIFHNSAQTDGDVYAFFVATYWSKFSVSHY